MSIWPESCSYRLRAPKKGRGRITMLRNVLLAGAFVAGLAALAPAQVEIQVRPPRAMADHRGPRPGRDYVWVPGYQRWSGNAYVWTPGRWDRPPRPHQRWVAGHYVRRG